MTDFKCIFENDWCTAEVFLEKVIKPVFGDYEKGYHNILEESSEIKEKSVLSGIEEIKHCASFDLLDGNEIKIFDITVTDNKRLENNKVGIQNIVRQYIDYYEGSLLLFHHKNVLNREWRLSYVEKRGSTTETTSAKRYTYILGKGNPARTITERFQALEKKKDFLTLQDLTDAFSVETLTKQFYKDLFNWYDWACSMVKFPEGDTSKNSKGKFNVRQTDKNNNLNLIRLITRLMFVWFIKQKNLIPVWIFDTEELKNVLSDFESDSENDGNYYNAIIQNLFFATLNKKIDERAFADDTNVKNNRQFGIKTFYRDNKKSSFFKETNRQIIDRFKCVPFLNGGLFECLDKLTDDKNAEKNIQVFTDGFSREPEWMAFVPNTLFWHTDDSRHEGIINIFKRYNFTVEENTPQDVQVALDPELLGKVFENLLGTYNPETSETARKDSGSFYTPREIVNFIVDEALKNYLLQTVKNIGGQQLALLFNDSTQSYSEDNKNAVVQALKAVKILDPACGSGAFPMGALQRMILLIKKCGGITGNPDETYQLKLDLIENCLFGADIQPIAVQICKLRFFISLICEQEKTDNATDNYGFNPLPNLETKFVAANTLIGKKKKGTPSLFDNPEIDRIKKELQEKRHEHFNARTAETKAKYRKEDMALRQQLADLLAKDSMCDQEDAKQLASWNPYDQNGQSTFFDPEWMFGIKDGFDIIIGNPPYIQLQKDSGKLAELYKQSGFQSFAKTGDIYCLFYEKGYELLKDNGYLCFITSNKWMRAGYGEKLRGFFAQKTNPKLLIDFAGVRIFESATVDTNILLFEKSANRKETKACVAKNLTENDLNNLSLFVQQNSSVSQFDSSDSWVVLNPIEQSIKQKIEKAGIPLKDWDINIYRGILTGFNDAFIISEEKKKEILANCLDEDERKRTDELIRPILRGRDIKRYGYEYADLYLIATFPSRHYDIEQYPAVKKHLLSFGMERLEQTGKEYVINGKKVKARKKTNNKWFETQDSINYWEEFNKPKIVWGNLNLSATYALISKNVMINAPATMIVPANKYLLAVLNSKVSDYYIRQLGVTRNGGYFEYKPMFVEKFPIPKNCCEKSMRILASFVDAKDEVGIDKEVYRLYGLSDEEIHFIEFQESR